MPPTCAPSDAPSEDSDQTAHLRAFWTAKDANFFIWTTETDQTARMCPVIVWSSSLLLSILWNFDNSKSKGPNSFVWIIETMNNWGLKCIHIFRLGLQNDFELSRIFNYWSLNYRSSTVFVFFLGNFIYISIIKLQWNLDNSKSKGQTILFELLRRRISEGENAYIYFSRDFKMILNYWEFWIIGVWIIEVLQYIFYMLQILPQTSVFPPSQLI